MASFTASFRCASITHSGTQSHTERGGSMVLSKTPIRRSWLHVRLHIEMMDCAMLESLFLEICIVEVFIFGVQLPILKWGWDLKFGSLLFVLEEEQ